MHTVSSPRLLNPKGEIEPRIAANSGVFTPNMKRPVHRWFRYSAGFSAAWAESVIRDSLNAGSVSVLDPFAGSGTTLIAAQVQGARSLGLETHPLVARVARAKLGWDQDPNLLERRASRILRRAKPRVWKNPPPLLDKIFPRDTLATLLGIRDCIEDEWSDDPIDELLWLALVAILRACSPVGTAQWQYVLPKRSKARTAEPRAAFQAQSQLMAADMRTMSEAGAITAIHEEDARRQEGVEADSVDLVLTSPPYPNNYDYADATRIEMTFLGTVQKWGDLQTAVRAHLIRSCSQHMVRYDPTEALEAREIAPIRQELVSAFRRLEIEREKHGGRKAYHLMIAAYFHDLGQTFTALRRVCRPGATALFVVGDSAPYAVHIPVEQWLGEMALGAGFRSWRFEKLRDRNVKWKNRKHRVPLHEGILTLQG